MVNDLIDLHSEFTEGEALTLTIRGRLDSATTGKLWTEIAAIIERTSPARVVLDASGIAYCDGSGVGLLMEIRRRQDKPGKTLEIRYLRPEFQSLLDFFDPADFMVFEKAKPRPANIAEEIGRAICAGCRDARALITFLGECGSAFISALRNPGRVRWKDALFTAETAGVNALPIVALIGFLMGLIIAFQSAVAMRQFGAEIFVANLIGLSMVRELGPLMTAIVLAGRSGSAFAAELGTMKVNEEIDALTTMGLDPIRFLVVPRIVAAVVITPLLTVFADLVGIMGGSVVLLSLGYPLITYLNQIISSVSYADFLGGLFKSVIFGLLVAGIGCLRGLQTRTGARSVGESTTLAVVGGIVLIVITDGVFSVVFFYLGI